jgi:hypothetical protein
MIKMSIENPLSPNYGWKVDPDNRQDRGPGPVTVRKMTEEEKRKVRHCRENGGSEYEKA